VAFQYGLGTPGGLGLLIRRKTDVSTPAGFAGLRFVASVFRLAVEMKQSKMRLVEVRVGVTKYPCHANGSSARGDTVSRPVPRLARIRYRTTVRSGRPGSTAV